jgi:hypothetical protein
MEHRRIEVDLRCWLRDPRSIQLQLRHDWPGRPLDIRAALVSCPDRLAVEIVR